MSSVSQMRPIPGYLGYHITTDGRVWSSHLWRKAAGRWIRAYQRKSKRYLTVTLCRAGVQRSCYIHRLVLETFVGPCPLGMEACHNNGDPTDNRLENLRWDTRSGNQKDTVRHGNCALSGSKVVRAKGEQAGNSRLTGRLVRQMIYTHCTGLFAVSEIAKMYGIGRTTVDAIVRRRTWKHLWRGL